MNEWMNLETLTTCLIQGVPINMGIERRLECRLWFPIIYKWHIVHEKKNESLNELSKMWSAYKVS